MAINRYFLAITLILGLSVGATARTFATKGLEWAWLHGVEYEVNAGCNIGGAAPFPIPAEIRNIDSYNPSLNLQIGATATKWFDSARKWGLAVGVRFESKGMKTGATVKNYGMEIIQDGKKLKGNWTGKVKTTYNSNQLSIPVTLCYRINERWKLNAGPYIALSLSHDFHGYVSEGYLREGDPTGQKITFEGDSRASYDFSDEMRLFQWGMQAGGSWLAFKHLSVNANLTWGFNNIFNSSFKTVSFDLYPVYLNLGFGYTF